MNMWRLRVGVHQSWLIAVFCLGVVIGVILVPHVTTGLFSSIAWLLVGIGVMAMGLWRRRLYVIPLVIAAGVLIGLWRGGVMQLQLSPYEHLLNHQALIVGRVTEDVDIGQNNELILRINVLEIDRHAMEGSVWVSASSKADIKRGDIVTVKGKVDSGFGGFTASVYRAAITKVQRPHPGDVAGHVRDRFAEAVREAIPEPQASLGIGYLVGQRRALPQELVDALRIAGLTHIIVASGYNLTILVRLARRVFVKVSKYLAAISAGGMIVAFIAVTGASPSMSRAGLVAGLSLLAWYYGRKFHPLVLLPFAAAVTLLVNPAYGWNDLGWQLSFAAFAGVMIVAPLAQRYLFGEAKPGVVRQILGETISAQVTTLPILIMAFGLFSNVAVIANLLILPFVPLAMLGVFIAGIGGLFISGLAAVISLPITWLLQYMTTVATYLSALPWAQSDLSINTWVVVLYYSLLAGVCLYVSYRTKYSLRDANIIE